MIYSQGIIWNFLRLLQSPKHSRKRRKRKYFFTSDDCKNLWMRASETEAQWLGEHQILALLSDVREKVHMMSVSLVCCRSPKASMNFRDGRANSDHLLLRYSGENLLDYLVLGWHQNRKKRFETLVGNGKENISMNQVRHTAQMMTGQV